MIEPEVVKGSTKKTAAEAAQKNAYRQRLKGGIVFQRKFGRIERYRSYVQILAHNFYAGVDFDTDHPTINLVASRVRAQAPKMAFGIPEFDIKAYGGAPQPNSEAAIAAVLRMLWEQEAMDSITRKCTLDWPLFGLGVGFVGYEQGFEGAIIDSRRKLFGLLPTEFTKTISKMTGGLSDKVATKEERSIRMMLRERLFLERVSPFNFIIDPCADSWENAQFMARKIFLPRDRAILMFGKDTPKDTTVANVALFEDAGEDDPFGEPRQDEASFKMPDEVKRVEIWEMWDISTRKTVYLDAKGYVIGDHIYDWRTAHPGFPFVPLIWDEIPDVVLPEGLAAAIKPMNDELHQVRSRQLSELGKAKYKWRVDPGVGRDARLALQSEVDGALVEAEAEDVESLQATALGQDVFNVENRIKTDIDEVTYTSAYDASSMPVVSRTATEASFAQSSSDAVSAWRKTAVERYASEVAERMLALILTTFDEQIMVSIVNNDPAYGDIGATIDFPFIGIDHGAAYRIKTIEDTMMAMSNDIQRQQLMSAYELFKEEDWFKKREAAAQIYSTMPAVRDPYKLILTQEELQLQQQQAQMQQPPMQGGMMPGMGMPPGMPGLGQAPQQQMLAPPGQGQGGSGNMTADLLAATMGGQAPMTGANGLS